MINKIITCCTTISSFVYDNSMSAYELILKCIEKVNELVNFSNGFQAKLDLKENIVDITNNRKLSETGDFTGTLYNNSKTAYEVILEIDSNTDQIQFLTNQFADGATGLVIDGGFFLDDEINKNYDGGVW